MKYAPHFANGLSRRQFLKSTSALALLSTAGLTKPSFGHEQESSKIEANSTNNVEPLANAYYAEKVSFSDYQAKVIKQVQMHLFPDDGDGPSANDLQAYEYLLWALAEPDNQQDGDQAFITQGLTWLDQSATKHYKNTFLKMANEQQSALLKRISGSRSGENWLSLLLYYLLESLTLDPLYGGNPNGVGWTWLQHQPGFPAPDAHSHYRVFES
ncbi:MAG: gluconate 2-dehydrogenase subunit 3 family protein [Parashewanella sp.]